MLSREIQGIPTDNEIIPLESMLTAPYAPLAETVHIEVAVGLKPLGSVAMVVDEPEVLVTIPLRITKSPTFL